MQEEVNAWREGRPYPALDIYGEEIFHEFRLWQSQEFARKADELVHTLRQRRSQAALVGA